MTHVEARPRITLNSASKTQFAAVSGNRDHSHPYSKHKLAYDVMWQTDEPFVMVGFWSVGYACSCSDEVTWYSDTTVQVQYVTHNNSISSEVPPPDMSVL